MGHFTINVLIDIKFSSCYTSEFIPYTYLNYNYVFINVNIFISWDIYGKNKKKIYGGHLYNDSLPPPVGVTKCYMML